MDDALLHSLLSGLVATLVSTILTLLVTYWIQRDTEKRARKAEKRAYKLEVFREIIAMRTDLSHPETCTGKFCEAINQVFIAYNDSPEVLKAFEEFREKVMSESKSNDEMWNKLVHLFKAMASDLSVDYSFANDDLFTRPIHNKKESTSSKN